jgi:hypothetical protein
MPRLRVPVFLAFVADTLQQKGNSCFSASALCFLQVWSLVVLEAVRGRNPHDICLLRCVDHLCLICHFLFWDPGLCADDSNIFKVT